MRKEKILIVDDDRMMFEIYRTVLTGRDYFHISYAPNGIECYEQLMGSKTPDIILLDHHLDILNGLTILKRIKSISPKAKVIYISGQQDVDIAIRSLKFGAEDYLIKDDRLIPNLDHCISVLERDLKGSKKRVFWRNAIKMIHTSKLARRGPKSNIKFQNETSLEFE